MVNFTDKLSGLVLAGFLFGLTYLAVLLAGERILPFSSPVGTAQLVKLSATDGAPQNPCVFRRAEGVVPVIGMRAGASDEYLYVEVIEPDAFRNGAKVFFAGTILDRAEMNLCSAEGQLLEKMMSGDSLYRHDRQLPVPEVAFEVPQLENGQRLLLGVKQETIVNVSMRVMEAEAFFLYSAEKVNIRIALLGGLISIILYNLVLGALVLQWTYFFNALNSACMVFLDLCLTGLGSTYIWSDMPQLSGPLLTIALAGPCMFGVLFVFHYLYPGDWARLHRMPVFSIWLYAAVIMSIYSFAAKNGIGELALIFGWVFTAIIIISKLVQLALQGNERAQILLVPFLAVIIPSLCAGIARVYFGWNIGRLGDHHTEITYLLEALMFTLSLAYLLRITEREREMERKSKMQIIAHSQQQLLGLVDRERTRISSDLHDTAGQGLVTVAGRLNRIGKLAKLDPEHREQIKDVERTMKSLLDDIRRISHDLHPAALDHIGLDGAIRELARQLSHSGGAEVAADIRTPDGLSKEDGLQIFRIVQELLSNAVRHSGASKISASLQPHKQGYYLQVQDNGKGMRKSTGSGIGLQVVSQRADMLGGRLSVRSTAEGTSIRVSVPVIKETQDREEMTGFVAGTERGIAGV